MPKFRVELCYTVPHYAEINVEAPDADAAQAAAFHAADGLYDHFEPCLEASGDTYVSECVEGDFDAVADAPQDAHRPIHPDFCSDDQNTAAARDKLHAFVERLAAVEVRTGGEHSATLRGLITAARDLIGWAP